MTWVLAVVGVAVAFLGWRIVTYFEDDRAGIIAGVLVVMLGFVIIVAAITTMHDEKVRECHERGGVVDSYGRMGEFVDCQIPGDR